MIVTFISQCEKKALNKTRRVLDAFANRIGSNTWQTVITEQGLQAVKKLLRKTASKNTAVSCHWIRSRSRIEFLWVVGSKDKFNSEGIVPVNYTEQPKFIGEIKMEKNYANTKKQPLEQHLFAVGTVAYLLAKRFSNNSNIALAAFIAGCWHDMGKIDPSFQDWLNNVKKDITDDSGVHITTGKFSWKNHPRHNEISLILYMLFGNQEDLNKETKLQTLHSIYWHHAKPIRSDNVSLTWFLDKLEESTQIKNLYPTVKYMLVAINNMASNYSDINFPSLIFNGTKAEDYEDIIDSEKLPQYKPYKHRENIEKYSKQIISNANNNIVRSSVITADRLISGLSVDELHNHIENQTLNSIIDKSLIKTRNLKTEILKCLQGFEDKYPDSERNKQQRITASDLSDEEVSIGVLNGPAGCGKTKIALEWAKNTNAKKLLWICPRVQICQGLIQDLISEESLPSTKIEICTGEFQQIYQNGQISETPQNQTFSGDIVITTIDQVINFITTHAQISTFSHFLDAHVVFDEYHEYIHMPAFNLLFAELIECKKMQQNDESLPNTLLVSATPNPYFVEKFLNINLDDNMFGIKSFNQSQYQIKFQNYDETVEDDSNPLYAKQPQNTFVISNTAITAQKSFITNQNEETSILIHSKYTKKDRKNLFNKVFNSFKQNGNKQYDILRAGPLVQASLNITCSNMITEATHAENWLQRLGRLDRFGNNNTPNNYLTVITEGVETGQVKGKVAKFLNNLNSLQSTKTWIDFLKNKLDDQPISITQLYQLYDEYYKDENCQKMIAQDFMTGLAKSIQVISFISDPVEYPKKNKPKDDSIKIKKNSLRGDSRFVQMAEIKIKDDKNISYLQKYSAQDAINMMTTGLETICGYGDSEKNLLFFMKKKHHNIIDDAKKAYKDSQLINEARNPETPIYLSYTPEDLKKVEATQHPYSIYYAQGKHLPIGAISIKQLEGE